MKRSTLIVAVLATFAIASCGGSSSTSSDTSPTPTPTNANSKAVSQATLLATNNATGDAAAYGLQNLTPTGASTQATTNKAAYGATIDYTYQCTISGTVLATGSMTAQCTESGGNWSCSNMVLDLDLQFNDCMETANVDGTDYTVALNGPGTALMTGTASGTDNSASVNVSGTAEGTLTATGDANGTVTLNMGIDVSGSVDTEPTVTCSGTASIVTDAVTEVCGITSTCDGCTE